MPGSDPAAALNWPTIPACYGWLSLDRRGCWKLKGEGISHAGLIAFINSRYAANESGSWIVRNGPQAVFVALDYTPFVLRLDLDDRLTAHTGDAAGLASAAYLDEEGNVLLQTALGVGLLDDRDLPAFIAACRNAAGQPADEDALLDAMNGTSAVVWHGLPVRPIRRSDAADFFGYCPNPKP